MSFIILDDKNSTPVLSNLEEVSTFAQELNNPQIFEARQVFIGEIDESDDNAAIRVAYPYHDC